MISSIVLTIHVIVAVALIIVVLFQQGKGANIGATFGGSSQTLFGPRGAYSAMAKITTGAAIMFMFTSITLSIMSDKTGASSIIDTPVAEESTELPTTLPPTDETATPLAETPAATEAGPTTAIPGENSSVPAADIGPVAEPDAPK